MTLTSDATGELALDGYRVSPLQRRLWQLGQQDGAAPYRVWATVDIQGPLAPPVLASALREVVGRYEVLRTRLRTLPAMTVPVQVIGDENAVDCELLDLTPGDPAGLAARFAAARDEHLRHDADPTAGPVLRILLARVGTERHKLVMSLPAVCADAGSLPVLVEAVAHTYASFVTGGTGHPAGDPPQYADVTEWLNELLESADTKRGREHWAGLAAPLPLAGLATHAPTAAARFTPRQLPVELRPGVLAAAEAMAGGAGSPLESILLTAWQVVLGRFTGAPDVFVGVARDGRDDELADVVGPLTRHVPRPGRIDGTASFRELTARFAEVDRGLDRWHAYFEWEQAARLDGDHDVTMASTARTDAPTVPYFPLAFEALPLPPPWQAGDVAFRLEAIGGHADRFDVKLSCRRANEGAGVPGGHDPARRHTGAPRYDLALHYNAAVVDPTSAARLATALTVLLADAVERPDVPVEDLAVLTPDQRETLIRDFGRTADPTEAADGPAYFPQLFEEQVRRTPDRAALVCAGRTLTYAELNARGNQLAHHLRRRGVGAEVLVGLLLEPSVDAIVALLGVLKAGGGYVPLDPDSPPSRLANQVEDAGLALALTRTELLPHLPPHLETVCLDHAEALRGEPVSDPLVPIGPHDPAYAVYTSGSTGEPKGVLIEHRSVAAFHRAMRTAVYDHMTAPGNAALNAPLTFDASVQQLVLLLEGHTLHVLPQQLRQDSRLLVDYLQRHRVDVLNATPTQLATLVADGLLDEAGHPPRLVLVAGEELPEPLARVLGRAAGTVTYNCYGPTECTVNATAGRVGNDPPSIGRPLPGYEVYLLDRRLRPVPVGAPGEMYLGGPAVARGYLGRPGATAERFVANPFTGRPGERLYRTGDLARFAADGRIEFLGRVDHQVKIRGFRVEPGEVVAALVRHPAVREAVVLARDGASGGKRLVAYCVFDGPPSLPELRDFLSGHLPAYLIPAAFVPVAAIPLTSSGKVDRVALAALDDARPRSDDGYLAPRFPHEEIMCAVWGAVLGVDTVGIDDNFFVLGGDSIHSIQLRAQAARRGLHFSVQQLFEQQTVRRLCQVLDAEADAVPASRVAPFALIDTADRERLPDGVVDAYPLAVGQAAMVFDSEFRRDLPIFHTTRTAQLRGPYQPEVFRRALAQVVADHPVLRTSFDMTGFAEPVQLVHGTVEVPLNLFDLRELPGPEQDRALSDFVAAEQRRRFDWAVAPLLRFALHRRSADTFQLTVTLHEAILDGWSTASLLTELFTRYLALVGGEEPAPAPCASSFADYVAAERQVVRHGSDRAFWERWLAGGGGAALPRWPEPEESIPVPHRVVEVPVDPDVSRALQTLARSMAVPLKSVLLAAHVRAMSLATGEPDVLTGLVTNSRLEVPDGERVLGQFLNSVPLRLQLTGGTTWTELVREVFAGESTVLSHRRYPMALVKHDGGGPFRLDSAFNFTHFHVYRSLERAGVEVLDDALLDQTGVPIFADFMVSPTTGAVALTLSCTGLSEAQVDAIGRYYRSCLTDLAARPDGCHGDLRWPPAGESLGDAETTGETPDSRGGCFAALFEAQVERTPDSVAATCRDQAISYRQLNDRANRLAAQLASAGAGPESVVSLLADRSIDFLVGVVAVFKAGAAYLPLEPSDPPAHLRATLDRSGSRMILVASTGLPVLDRILADEARERRPRVVTIGEERRSDHPAPNPPAHSDPRRLACLLYTSGSTGHPKGVLIEQRGLVNHLYAKIDDLSLGNSDRVAQTARTTFVVSLWQFLAPLLAGGQVTILSGPAGHDPTRLLPALARTGTTVAELVPSVLDALLEVAEDAEVELPSLRCMVSTGEVLPARVARRWLRRYPATALVNAYGLTECSDDVAHHRVSAVDGGANAPIGRPLPGVRMYVLDEAMAAAPTGVTGRLYLAGAGVSRGYLDDPAQTARWFVPDPNAAGERMYATGDLALRRPDGTVEYRGRRDRQVKIHGVRIEPAEVESVLATHPDVRDAVVTVRRAESGPVRLVAYVVGEIDPSALGEFARARLPAAFVPAAFVALPALPRNANGKVDHGALPAPESTGTPAARPFAPPSAGTEQTIADIYARLLPAAPIGAHDSFFALGGDSLSATLLAFRIRAAFDIDLPLHEVYDRPTVAELARLVETTLDGTAPDGGSATDGGSAPDSGTADGVGGGATAGRAGKAGAA